MRHSLLRTFRSAAFVAAALGGGLAGCDSPPVAPPAAATLAINGLPELVGVGDTVVLGVAALDAAGRPLTGARVSWESVDPAVATVDSTGRLVALTAGTLTVRATAGSAQTAAAARVERLPRRLTITVSRPSLALVELRPLNGTPSLAPDTATASATVLDGLGIMISGATVEWETSDSSVVRVDAVGRVRGVGVGTASLVARSGALEASVPVSVDFMRYMPALSFASASMGDWTVCGITVGGEARCDWGGPETRDPAPPPALVSVWTGSSAKCGITADGTLYCWGYGPSSENDFGELGIGVLGPQGDAKTVPQLVHTDARFTKISVGQERQVCGLATTGVVYCWGKNSSRNLGIPDINRVAVPTPIASEVLMTDISVGFGHECAVGTNGKAYCWGLNGTGAVGVPPSNIVSSPTEVEGGRTFVSVAAGGFHTCALTPAGEAWCWGDNKDGQLGRGTADPGTYSTPAPVLGGLTFTQLAAGYYHTCGLTAAGLLYCWGGEPVNAWQAPQATPTLVSATRRYRSVSAHAGTCAVAEDGALYCWGW